MNAIPRPPRADDHADRVTLGQRAEDALAAALARSLSATPSSAVHLLARGVGSLAYGVLTSRRRVALDNLSHAFPELDADARRAIARASFRHLASTALETLALTRVSGEELGRRISVEGGHHLTGAREAGRGVLLFSAHLGNWEIIAHLSLFYRPFVSLVRTSSNPLVDRRVRSWRERSGTVTVDRRRAARTILEALRRGELAGWMVDQRVLHREGVHVPFFGRVASTSPLMAKLSLRTGAPAVPLFVTNPSRGRWTFELREPIHPRRTDGPAELTARYLSTLETEIRQRPGEWLWMHHRWR